MGLFDVYSLLEIEPVKAKGAYLWDKKGERYLDFYGGHAVISIGHSHPVYVEKLTRQLNQIGFYSNAVVNPLQQELAEQLCRTSGYSGYNLFLCNSGAEANENALKLASFVTGREKVLAFKAAFHGRTSAAVAVTDNPAIQAPLNQSHAVTFVPLNDREAAGKELLSGDYAAVIIEGIQGVGGIRVPGSSFLQWLADCCRQTATLLIVDEVQSGCGRTGKFFAHQHAAIKPDLITMAKGMGNGFPVAGLLISPCIEARKGMLGTTFGGSHLACVAALAVLEVINREYLIHNAAALGKYLIQELKKIKEVKEVRGEGLMIGVETAFPQAELRKVLTADFKVMTGYSGQYTLRLLPPLIITRKEADEFLSCLKGALQKCEQRKNEKCISEIC